MDNELLMKEAQKVKEMPIVFILGRPRSGTTLLQSSLDAHPNIVSPPESPFINVFYPRFGGIKHWNESSVLEFADAVFSEPFLSNLWLMDKEQVSKKLVSLSDYADYPLLCKMVYYQMRKNDNNVLLICDKNPSYSLFAKKLLHIFPEAKFIHIIREPRDNVNSNIKRLQTKNTFFLARQWVGFNTCIENFKRKFPDKFFTIIYEDMVRNPENVFNPLCEFLHVPYNNSMMNHRFLEMFKLYEGRAFYEGAKTQHKNLLKPINASNIGKWKNEMSDYDRAVTEIITAKYARKQYGYDVVVNTNNKIKISFLKLFKSQVQYILWKIFTRIRFSNFTFNKWYCTRRNKIFKKTVNLKFWVFN